MTQDWFSHFPMWKGKGARRAIFHLGYLIQKLEMKKIKEKDYRQQHLSWWLHQCLMTDKLHAIFPHFLKIPSNLSQMFNRILPSINPCGSHGTKKSINLWRIPEIPTRKTWKIGNSSRRRLSCDLEWFVQCLSPAKGRYFSHNQPNKETGSASEGGLNLKRGET